jgi:hypothetical protein
MSSYSFLPRDKPPASTLTKEELTERTHERYANTPEKMSRTMPKKYLRNLRAQTRAGPTARAAKPIFTALTCAVLHSWAHHANIASRRRRGVDEKDEVDTVVISASDADAALRALGVPALPIVKKKSANKRKAEAEPEKKKKKHKEEPKKQVAAAAEEDEPTTGDAASDSE